MQPGDEVVQINGADTRPLSHLELIDAAKKARATGEIRVRRTPIARVIAAKRAQHARCRWVFQCVCVQLLSHSFSFERDSNCPEYRSNGHNAGSAEATRSIARQ
jgi:hypothetical protein